MSKKPTRTGSRDYYNGKFFLVFYDKNDEYLEYSFDNVKQILKFMGKEVTRTNINLVNVELYRALKSESHFVKFLTGKLLKVYAIPLDDEDEA